MPKTRRQFILETGAAFVAGSLERATAEDPSAPGAQDIRALLATSGFDPSSGNSALLAVIADPHIMLGPEYPNLYTETWEDALISEINTLEPKVTDLVIAGDLISHFSINVGGPRYPSHVTRALNEFQLAKREIARFRSDIRLWAVPGNHDTDAYEIDAEMWRERLQTPPYQKAVLAGVPVFFLNSGNGGMLNPGQLAWFKEEVRTIPKDQEVLIVVHHPSFLHLWEEAGVKRILADAFAGHESVVWLASGHGHFFADQLCVHKGTRFVQMEVTAAHRNSTDRLSPGYIVLALQNGRVISRIFRSLKKADFEVKPSVGKMTPTRVKWPFDGIAHPAEIFEEGFYNRTDHLVSFNGVDVGCHFVFCKSITFRVKPSKYSGKVDSFSLAAYISPSLQPIPTCSFSITGTNGSWSATPFPVGMGHGLYNVPIPPEFQSADDLFIKVETALTKYAEGFNHCGFALAAHKDRLTEYEKWISRRYRTIAATPETVPDAITPQSSHSNILNFAFNLPTAFSGPQGPSATLPSAIFPTGLPKYSKSQRQVTGLRFARRTADSGPGVNYHVEESTDLLDWTQVNNERLVLSPLEPGWEEVVFTLPVHSNTNCFCRVRIVGTETIDGAFNQWQSQVAVTGGTPDDWNANGTSDLMEFAFDLEPGNGGLRFYDPDRASRKAGIPVQISRIAELPRIVFPRMRSAANPGVTYTVESSIDEITWTPLATWEYSEQVLRSEGDWDEVEVIVLDRSPVQEFYRIRLDLESPLAS